MRMSLLDWLIPLGLFLTLLVFALRTRKYSDSVSGFLAANRCAGRYLICVSYNMAQVGIITLVWFFQQYYDAGFTSIWWGLVENPVMILIALTGWVIYRFRETRAMTLAQFFEIRYSRRFRVFSGMVAFLAGILNYAIFPAVSARFFMGMCGLPESFTVAGVVVHTFPALMAVLLSSAILFVFLGGQIAVMVTDFLQGIFCNIVFLVLIAWTLLYVGWGRMAETMLAQPEGRSMVNPLAIGQESQFNLWYWLISAFVLFYTMKAWQGDQGYNAAAITPHEAKMAQILSGWRWRVLMLVTVVVPIGVKTVLQHPDFAAVADPLNAQIAALGTPALQAEARVPLALGAILPMGILGLVVAAMYGAYLSTDDTYLHSWGSILVQDVVLPIRSCFTETPMSQGAHLLLLKSSIFGVAVFAFLFGLFYEPNQYIAMWGALTASVFVAAAGSVIIGGLYWRRGTTLGAWAAMLTGIGLSLAGIMAKDRIDDLRFLADGPFDAVWRWFSAIHANPWLSGQVLSCIAMVSAITVYVTVSLAGRKPPFDLDRMLYRGPWRATLPESERDFRSEESLLPQPPGWMRALGFSREYSRADTWITTITVLWPLAWTIIFVAGTTWALTVGIEDAAWLRFWHGWTWLIFGVGCAVMVWFTIGGFRDLSRMYAHLRRYRADAADDGSVPERRK
jgi:SSS family solute:Na+ symporter